ncbi:MAG TPA: response regulator [Candidatus Thermoplasmatota archaeon]|nr:response regulator [Candidatus Thermoplasmatota archaeon]
MRPQRRILLLEDDPDEARRSRDTLADNGYTVHVASTLAAARQAVAHGDRFDLVFLDQNLPDGEGLTIIPHLRSVGMQAPVVLVTGNRSEQTGKRAFLAGCADLAVKEVNYHLWLPTMAEAFLGAGLAASETEEFRWGPHVLGVCTGRLQGPAHAMPSDFWAPFAGALHSAAELAVRGLRATGQSLLGSVPVVHLELGRDRHLLLVVRGGVFAAAMLSRAPRAQDTTELVGEAAAFSRARSDADPGSAAA